MTRYILIVFLTLWITALRAQTSISSPSDDFSLRIIGRALFDAGIFLDDKSELGNGVKLTDGRIGAVVNFLSDWEGKIEFGYSNGKVGVRDVFVTWSQGKSKIQIGHFFEPYGISGRVGTSDVRIMNVPNSASVFGDKRKIGFTYTYDKDLFTGTAGVFGDGDTDNSKGGNEGYSLSGKAILRPYYTPGRVVHLGASLRFSEHDKDESDKTVIQSGLPSQILNSSENRFLKAEISDIINQWKFGGEAIVVYDNFFFQSEYNRQYFNRRSGLENYIGTGGYIQGGLLLLGDKKYKYSQAQGWVSNPSPGNLEFVLRYNITDLNNKDAGVSGGKLQDVAFGANYFINKYVAVKFSYTHAELDKHALFGKESVDYLQMRFQLNF